MSLGIQSNLASQQAQRMTLGASRRNQLALQKLSSGFKINTAQDGPAGLIISELLRSQMGGLGQAVRNSQEANNVLGIAEGGLGEISGQLRKMRELAVHALNSGITSSAQTAADQSELNSALAAISRISANTRYSNQNLLDGSQGFTFSADDPAGMLDVAASRLDKTGDIAGQSVRVQYAGNASQQAERAMVETNFATGATAFATEQRFTLTGQAGSAAFRFAAGTTLQNAVDLINNRTASTGVEAFAIRDAGSGATEIRLASANYGSEATVQVNQDNGEAFAAAGTVARDAGQDAVVNVDGREVSTQGLSLDVDGARFSGRLQFQASGGIAQTGYDQDTLVDANAPVTAQVGDIQGGMRFQLGEGAGVQSRERLGLSSFNPSNLGRVLVNGAERNLADLMGGGAASLANDPEAAIKIIDQAIGDVSSGRARIGAYQANTLETNINSLSVALENVTATESAIRDADMATAISDRTREQILLKTGILGVQASNMSAENVLKLLGG